MSNNLHDYALRIDGPLLANQRRLLVKVMDTVFRDEPYVAETPKDGELLQGLAVLLDEIADQAHDRHGLDSLIKPEPDETEEPGPHNQYRCECELPGQFCSGVPGILAHLENGRLPEGAQVERCGLCCRYPSDAAALEKLQELGYAPPVIVDHFGASGEPADEVLDIQDHFECPKCKSHRMEEIMDAVVVASQVRSVGFGGDVEYGEQSNEDGVVERYQCMDCGWIVPGVRDAEELFKWLKDSNRDMTPFDGNPGKEDEAT